MMVSRVLAVFAMCGVNAAAAIPDRQNPRAVPVPVTATIDGWVNGKRTQAGPGPTELGADAAVRLLAASDVVNFFNPGQSIDSDMWRRQVAIGIGNGRSHLRVRFAKPRTVEGRLNGAKATF